MKEQWLDSQNDYREYPPDRPESASLANLVVVMAAIEERLSQIVIILDKKNK